MKIRRELKEFDEDIREAGRIQWAEENQAREGAENRRFQEELKESERVSRIERKEAIEKILRDFPKELEKMGEELNRLETEDRKSDAGLALESELAEAEKHIMIITREYEELLALPFKERRTNPCNFEQQRFGMKRSRDKQETALKELRRKRKKERGQQS
jgi:hypothetical protein